MDDLFNAASAAFDPAERDAVLAKVHAREVDDAAFMGCSRRRTSSHGTEGKGYVQAKNWFQSLTSAYRVTTT